MELKYKFKIGDKVWVKKEPRIIFERYYPKGFGFEGNQEAYVTYPPGKKNSVAHHQWSLVEDITVRK